MISLPRWFYVLCRTSWRGRFAFRESRIPPDDDERARHRLTYLKRVGVERRFGGPSAAGQQRRERKYL